MHIIVMVISKYALYLEKITTMFEEQRYLAEEVKEILNTDGIVPLFVHTGVYTYQSVNTHLVTLRQYLESHIATKNAKRSIYNILVECIENINRHGFVFRKEDASTSNYGYVIFASEPSRYSIWVGNFIPSQDIHSIKRVFDEVTSSNNEELKTVYRHKLANNELSDKQGMGIGIIDIALRSKEPIKFTIKDFKDTTSFFSLEITVNK